MSDGTTIIVPAENRTLVIPGEKRTIDIPGESRVLVVPAENRVIEVKNMAQLGSKQHTVGNSIVWTLCYGKWLVENAAIETMDITSSSDTCTVGEITVLGPDVTFLLIGGIVNERLTVLVTMTDNLHNIKNDTIAFTVVAA